MNNFEDYGFKAGFRGEILRKTNHNIYIGYIVEGKDIEYAIEWNCKGDNLLNSRFSKNYNLTPIKKQWYENTDNFPCIVMQVNCVDSYEIDCGHLVFRNIDDFNKFGGDYRFLTKEEVLSLLIKE